MTSSSSLFRVDYAQMGITNYRCIRVIHNSLTEEAVGRKKGAKKRQKSVDQTSGQDKVVIGAQSGVMVCFERKNGETNIVYKTPPGAPISYVCIGGALQSAQNKAFVATRTEVKGFSMKGKQFLEFESNIAEGISLMYIYGVDMFLCSRNTLYHFHDCVEKNSFTCSDIINDVICLPVTEGGWVGRGITPVIACSDKTIKVIDGSRLAYEVHLKEVPNCLHMYLNDGGPNKQKVLYGTKNGLMGLVNLDVDKGEIYWEIETKSFSSISSMHCFNILEQTGTPDIVMGKDDGLIEIYSIDDSETPMYREQYQCDEIVTGIHCGHVNSPIFGEIVVCTYTGWVFALTTEPHFSEKITDTSRMDSSQHQAPQVEIKVQQLKAELEQLEKRVFEERSRIEDTTKDSSKALAVVPQITLNDRFVLHKELACYVLFIELSVPIDYILLQSDVKVDLMDVEKNSAVSGNSLLAVYRCQADVLRMEMRIRSIEGQFGTLRLYIVPKSLPLTCKLCTEKEN